MFHKIEVKFEPVFGCGLIAAIIWFGVQGSAIGLYASPVRVNLGTVAPQGSIYHRALLTMREQWAAAPGEGIRLVVYPDGTQGGEGDMVRLMRIGMLQAGLLTSVGLGYIEPEMAGLHSIPLIFHDLDEFDFVSEQLRPRLEKRLSNKGFAVLFWIDSGWVRFFTKTPIRGPDDLKPLKWFVWAGDVKQMDLLHNAGFHPVGLEISEVLPGLQTGLIDAVAVPPIYALATQLDELAPFMLELNWAPLIGAAVIDKKVWDKIPIATRLALSKAAKQAGREINSASREESDESVRAMEKRGLKVTRVEPEIEAEWIREAEAVYPKIRGNLVSEVIFEEVQNLLRQYRERPIEGASGQ